MKKAILEDILAVGKKAGLMSFEQVSRHFTPVFDGVRSSWGRCSVQQVSRHFTPVFDGVRSSWGRCSVQQVVSVYTTPHGSCRFSYQSPVQLWCYFHAPDVPLLTMLLDTNGLHLIVSSQPWLLPGSHSTNTTFVYTTKCLLSFVLIHIYWCRSTLIILAPLIATINAYD